MGLWIGLQLTDQAGPARPYCEALKDRGILAKDTHGHTIRFAPPLVITKEEIDEALAQIREVLN
jgi:ornithine--oxo-acid transaminase